MEESIIGHHLETAGCRLGLGGILFTQLPVSPGSQCAGRATISHRVSSTSLSLLSTLLSRTHHVFIIRVEQWLQVASRLCMFCQLRTPSRLLIGISNWGIRWEKAPLAKSTVRCPKLPYQSRSEHCITGALNWATGETVAVKEITLSNIPKSELGEIMVRGPYNLFESCSSRAVRNRLTQES